MLLEKTLTKINIFYVQNGYDKALYYLFHNPKSLNGTFGLFILKIPNFSYILLVKCLEFIDNLFREI